MGAEQQFSDIGTRGWLLAQIHSIVGDADHPTCENGDVDSDSSGNCVAPILKDLADQARSELANFTMPPKDDINH